MRGNSGIIGGYRTPSTSGVSGRYDGVDQSALVRSGTWPSTWQFKYCMPSRTTVQRNGAVTFYIATAGIPTSTTLYYTLEGSGITTDDFFDGLATGTVTASSGLVSFSKTIMPLSGAQKQFRCVVRFGSVTGPVAMFSPWVTIPAASITISPPSVVYEDDLTYTWTVSYSGFASNTARALYWAMSGTAATTDDISALSGVLTTRDLGSIALVNSTNSFSVTVLRDRMTEGNETLIPTIRINSGSGTILSTGLTSTVIDSSLSPVITADVTSVNEGGTVNYTLTLPDTTDTGSATLGYVVEAVSGTINSSDFVSALYGNVTFTNRVASLTQVLASDYATEGAESFRLGVRQRVDGSETVVMQALSGSYTLVKPNATIKSHASWNGTTTYVVNTDTYVVCPALGAGSYYVLSGSYVTESITYDPITVYSGVGTGGTQLTQVGGTGTLNYTSPVNTTITIRFKSDTTTVYAGFSLSLASYNVSNMPIIAYGPTITVADTSTQPQITLVSGNYFNEGDPFQFSVTGSDGTYYYTISGTATDADFNPSGQGTFQITGGTSGTITATAIADLLTEGTETFVLQIRSGSTSGPILATSSTVTLFDTSTTSVSVSPTSYNEGGTITFNVTGPNGTLYYSISGTNVTAADFADASLTGSVTITGNSGTFTKTLVSDLTTEGSETFTVSIRTGSVSGTVVATSPTITVNDTSVYTLSITGLTANAEDEGGAFTVTFGGPNGTYYYSLDGTNVTASDFSDASLTGSFTVASNTGSFTKTVSADAVTEGAETFIVNIRSGSVSGTILIASSSITINDTSLTPSGQNAKATAVYTATPAGYYSALDSDYTTLEASGVPTVSTVFGNTFARNALGSSFLALSTAAQYHTTVDTGLAGGYHAGVLLNDGRVLLLPTSGTTLKIYDPTLNTVTNATATLPSSSCANGGTLLADGRVVLWPKSYNKVMVLSADATSITQSTTSYSNLTTIAGGVLLPPTASNGGTVYLAPTDAHANSFYNPTTNTISFGNFTLPVGHILGGICPMWDSTTNAFGIFIPPTSEIANATATTLAYFYNASLATTTAISAGVTGAYTNPISVPGTRRVWLAPRSYTASPRWFLVTSGTLSTNVAVFGTLSGVLATTAQNYSKICHVPGSNDALLMMLPLNSGNTSGLYRPILFNHASALGREVHGAAGINAAHPAWAEAVYLLDGRVLLIPGATTSNMLMFKGSPHTLPAYLAKSSFFNT